ncbi:hypothetical protein Mapa_007123 [Marchantia paleacea]|nr:hypothetical protein Mapa_007123 [Marchantia paleacea]
MREMFGSCVTDYTQQTALKDHHVRKPHLRLTFFRVVKLVAKVGALPVFVVDGEPPSLKQGVRMKRFKRFASLCPSPPSRSPATKESSITRNGGFSANVEECVVCSFLRCVVNRYAFQVYHSLVVNTQEDV